MPIGIASVVEVQKHEQQTTCKMPIDVPPVLLTELSDVSLLNLFGTKEKPEKE